MEVAQPPFSHSSGLRYIIQRDGNTVIYRIGNWYYQSETPSAGNLYLDAALYSSNDYVDSPVIAPLSDLQSSEGVAPLVLGSASLALPEMTMTAAEGDYAEGSPSLSALQLAATGFTVTNEGGALTLPELEVFAADAPHAGLSEAIPALKLTATGGFPAIATSYGAMVFPPAEMAGVSYTGGVGSVEATLPELDLLAADRPYGAAAVTLPTLVALGSSGPPDPNSYGTMQFLYALDLFATDPEVYASIYEGLTLGSTEMTLVLLIDASYSDTLNLSSTSLSIAEVLDAVINEQLHLASDPVSAESAELQYAINLATSAAHTYQGFGFSGFARAGGRTFGYNNSGLFLVREGDDAGTPIRAAIDFGAFDFGVNQKKHMSAVWLGLDTDGEVFVRMEADDKGDERVYRVIPRGEYSRTFPDRGRTAREWRMKLEIVDATHFDLTKIEYAIRVSARRWSR